MFDWHVDNFRPPLGVGATILVVAALVALAVGIYLRSGRSGLALPGVKRLGLALLRLGAIAALAWMLAGPTIYRQHGVSTPQSPIVFLADTSASMTEHDAFPGAGTGRGAGEPAPVTRWQAIAQRWLDPKFIDTVAHYGAFQLVGFDSRCQPMTLAQARELVPAGRSTDLFGSVRQVVRQTPAGTLVVLSDGHDTQHADDPRLLHELAASGWRIIGVPVGASATVGRLTVNAFADADVVFAGQETTIHAEVGQSGLGATPPPVRIELRDAGRILDAREVAFDGRSSVQADFRFRPTAPTGTSSGTRTYQIVAASRDVSSISVTAGQPTGTPQDNSHSRLGTSRTDAHSCIGLIPVACRGFPLS